MKKQSARLSNFGFTLIELLITIAIIGILASAIIFSFSGAQKRARDATRRSDLKQYQTAIEAYAVRTGAYPAGASVFASTLTMLGLPNYPQDPKGDGVGIYGYVYYASSDGYSLYAWLESENNSKVLIYCSDGRNIETTDEEAVHCGLP